MEPSPTTYCIYASKSHHIVYLWQQEKNKPKPFIIIIMTARKNQTHLNLLLYLSQKKERIAIEFFLLSI